MVGEDVEREGEGTTITIIGIGIRLLDSSYKLFAELEFSQFNGRI